MAEARQTAQSPKAALPPKKLVPLTAGGVTEGGLDWFDTNHNFHFGAAPAGWEPEELSGNADFWISARERLMPYDSIRLVSADDEWIADYVVCRNRAVVLIPASVVRQPKFSTAYQVLEIPKPWVLKETGPRDVMQGFYFENSETGQKIFNAGAKPWEFSQRALAITEFNNLAMFRKSSAPPPWK